MGMYGENWQEIIAGNLSENVYISFDVDAFDPSLISCNRTPEPGGLFWDETMNLLKIVGMDRHIVGFDVVELAPFQSSPFFNYTAAEVSFIK